MAQAKPEDVLSFWFGDGMPRIDLWFGKDPAFDEEIRTRFGDALEAALHGALDAWTETPHGRLALVLVLDQFPRNAFRGTPQSFAGDERARSHVRRGLARGDDLTYSTTGCGFFYLPLEHAEDLPTQEESVRLYTLLHERTPPAQQGMTKELLEYAVRHRDIIARFGRFPHRNEILGRSSTPEELAFLREPNSSF